MVRLLTIATNRYRCVAVARLASPRVYGKLTMTCTQSPMQYSSWPAFAGWSPNGSAQPSRTGGRAPSRVDAERAKAAELRGERNERSLRSHRLASRPSGTDTYGSGRVA
eukprot:6212111-Pleurochrysis_carterae.AAC.3